MPAKSTRTDSIAELLNFINNTLPQLDRRERVWAPVDAQTPLFATGLLDSMSIVHLLAFVEHKRGALIPDRLIVMKNFQNADVIVDAFLT
jgi:hypothetical protein